jgi:hypothetical protein
MLKMIRVWTKVSMAATLLTAAVLISMTASPTLAANEKPDATVSFSGASAAAGVGVTWGSGTLHFQGKDYAFSLQGLGVADLGGSSIQGTGDVYNLKRVEDFAGSYAAASAAAAVVQGASETTMENERNVVLHLHSTTKGAQLKAAVEGITIELGDAAR